MSHFIPEESTIQDMLSILFPTHQHKKAARTAVEFFLASHHQGIDLPDRAADVHTLRRFVDFMIESGYN